MTDRLAAAPGARAGPLRRRGERLLPALVGGLLALLFAACAALVHELWTRELAARERQAAAFAAERLEIAARTLENLVVDLADVLARSEPIDAGDFRAVVETMVVGSAAEPAVSGVTVLPRLARDGEDPLGDFPARPTIWPDGPVSPAYPALFAWPPAAAPRILGYDMWTDPARRGAAREALALGQPQASAFVVLAQHRDPATGAGPYGTLLLMPIAGPVRFAAGERTTAPVPAMVAIGVSFEAFGAAALAAAPGRYAITGPVVENDRRGRTVVFGNAAVTTAAWRFTVPFAGLELELRAAPGVIAATPWPDRVAALIVALGMVVGAGVGLLIARNNAARREEAAAARRSQAMYELAVEAGGMGLWAVDPRRRTVALDARMRRLVGRPGHAPLVDLDDVLCWVHPRDRGGLTAAIDAELAHPRGFRREFRLRDPQGASTWLETFAKAEGEGAARRLVGLNADVTARRAAETELRRMALEDPLTGLANRNAFRRRLATALGGDGAAGRAIVLLDVDHFKDVNESHGHPFGDAVLAALGARLRAAVADDEAVARLGGDQFALIVNAPDGREAVLGRVRALLCRIAEPMAVDGQEVHLTASAGIAIAPDDAAEAEGLMRFADLALYRGKAVGTNVARLYSHDLGRELAARKRLERKLRADVPAERFEVHFQPVVDLATRSVVGAEALLRWQVENEGWVPPSVFVPVAESAGLMSRLERFVLHAACRAAADWPLAVDGRPLRVAVNLSSALWHAGDDVVEAVATALDASGLCPRRLTLEVTETALGRAEDEGRCTEALMRLRRAGVAIAIDDFGTGHSNLTRLRRLGFDELKVDKTFVAGMVADPDDAAVVRAVLGLGRAMGLRVVAEGIETEAQAGALALAGCRFGQGFLFARPEPEVAFRARLDAFPVAAN